MKILYLYAEVMGYTMATIQELAESGYEVHVVRWDHKKLTPYEPPALQNVYFHNRSELSVARLNSLVMELNPVLTVISGWMDKGYIRIARQLRRNGKLVVVGFDSHWSGNFKQWILLLLGKMRFLSLFYSHAWVPGLHQFEYARKLGFSKRNIVFDLLSADIRLFDKAFKDSVSNKSQNYPHRFLFVGRFEPVKGLDLLLEAWKMLGTRRGNWELHLIGNGSLRTTLENTAGVVVKDFMQPTQLMHEVASAGCFLLPSRSEPWGVVVHEFAAAGLPLVISDVVGAASTFLISGHNGFIFRTNDVKAIVDSMNKIINMADRKLYSMSVNSHSLSLRITPSTSAGNVISLINLE